jgi:hypothetical protein
MLIHIVVLWLTVGTNIMNEHTLEDKGNRFFFNIHTDIPNCSHMPQYHEYRITYKIQNHKFTKLPSAFKNTTIVSNNNYGHNYNLQLH